MLKRFQSLLLYVILAYGPKNGALPCLLFVSMKEVPTHNSGFKGVPFQYKILKHKHFVFSAVLHIFSFFSLSKSYRKT